MRSIYCVRASLRNLPATFNFDSISAVFIKHFAVLQSDSELLIIMHQTVTKAFQCSALNIMERADGTIENKLPLMEDRGQTDRVTILANPNPIRDLDL